MIAMMNDNLHSLEIKPFSRLWYISVRSGFMNLKHALDSARLYVSLTPTVFERLGSVMIVRCFCRESSNKSKRLVGIMRP